ncbi:DNA repair protein RecO [bacterium]|nr:DNA repair protein RecO [bacterium]
MNNLVIDAINLKSYNLSESDKIVVMYSKEHGLMRCVAKGVKKTKSRLGARMDSLVANKIMLHKGKNMDTICQAETLNTFSKSRQDLNKLLYSSYISEIISIFGIEDDPSSNETYNLFYKALNKIEEAASKKDIMLAVIKFQLKMMLIAGFGLELDTCLCCREQILNEDMYFSVQMGGVICKNCKDDLGVKLKLNYKIRDFLQAMLQFDFGYESDYDKRANEKVCDVCIKLLNDYIQSHSQRLIKTFSLLNTMQ